MNHATHAPTPEHVPAVGAWTPRRITGVPGDPPPALKAARSIGILSTYPPTQCGLATFSASMRTALVEDRPGVKVGIVRIGAEPRSPFDAEVTQVLAGPSGADSRAAAAALDQYDIAVLQHEFGIYGGDDGEQILDIVSATRVPVVVVAHTVPARPTPNQRRILESLVRGVDAVVTMSGAGRRRLLDSYQVDPRKLHLIPHGAPATVGTPGRVTQQHAGPVVLTWGLLGPGKGVEWGIEALSTMDRDGRRPTYIVAGQTHPKVLARDGERYRESLAKRARESGVGDLVQFLPGYLSPERLRELLAQADVVLLPYDSQEQVTSGVLTEALAAGLPVVATAFPHAVEMLADGKGGVLVPHADPVAIAAAVNRIVSEPGLSAAMSAHNAGLGALVGWPTVAAQYRRVFDALTRRHPRLIR